MKLIDVIREKNAKVCFGTCDYCEYFEVVDELVTYVFKTKEGKIRKVYNYDEYENRLPDIDNVIKFAEFVSIYPFWNEIMERLINYKKLKSMIKEYNEWKVSK